MEWKERPEIELLLVSLFGPLDSSAVLAFAMCETPIPSYVLYPLLTPDMKPASFLTIENGGCMIRDDLFESTFAFASVSSKFC